MSAPPYVITAAMVGAETTREQTPYLPITAEEIAEDAARCREAGAAMVHLHVRTCDGKPSQDAELFCAAIPAIRAPCDVLIHTSTGGVVGMTADERCGPLTLTGPDRPDMATLTTGTVNFGDEVFSHPRPLVWIQAGVEGAHEHGRARGELAHRSARGQRQDYDDDDVFKQSGVIRAKALRELLEYAQFQSLGGCHGPSPHF